METRRATILGGRFQVQTMMTMTVAGTALDESARKGIDSA
jgi:hypothetical protein